MPFDARALASMRPILSVQTSNLTVQVAIHSDAPGEWTTVDAFPSSGWLPAPSEIQWHRLQLVYRDRAA